jgi:hypothetical protein
VPDAAYQNALARRAALVKELERIDTFLSLYKEFDVVGDSALLPSPVKASAASTNDAPRAPRGTGAKMLDLAEEAIREAGRPMLRPDLLKAIEERGLTVGGKDPGATLASALWRDRDRFISLKGHGYWIKAQPYEPANYNPALESVIGVTDEAEPSDLDKG